MSCVERRQKTVSVLTNSVHKPLEFSFTTLYLGCCQSYLNFTGSDSLKHNSRRKKHPWQKRMLWQFMSRALPQLWDWPLIPKAGSVLKIIWTTSDWNEYSSQIILEGITFYIYQIFTFREHCRSRIALEGKLRLLIFSTAYKAKPCTSFSTFWINFYFLHY